MEFKLDMSMMFAVHDALRRDLGRLARAGTPPAAGWEMFKTFLRVHHTAEDVALWGPMETLLAGHPDRALLDAMEAEHAAIDPLLAAVDAAVADRDPGLGDVVDALYLELSGHLRHEEEEGLRLVDAVLTPQQWAAFGAEHRRRVGDGAVARYLPWVLDEASPETTGAILGRMPEPVRSAYVTEWRAAYAELRPWDGSTLRP